MDLKGCVTFCSLCVVNLTPLSLSAPVGEVTHSPYDKEQLSLDTTTSGNCVSDNIVWKVLLGVLCAVVVGIAIYCFCSGTCCKKKRLSEEQKRILSNEELQYLMEPLRAENEQIKEEREQIKEEREQLKDALEQLKKNDEIIGFSDARFYRVVVILNPSTAHPRLEVSKEGKCVRDTGSVLKVPKSEERFDSHMFVLAKEGFSKGRHYWEVEVGQKKNWDLGVASESISRQGKITLAPQNGYWVIGLDGKKDYWARTDPWTRLQVSGKLTKIGMFLNMPDKSLSFYDVNRRSKLHTFTLSSSEKRLYPFFSVGSVTAELDSHPLEIPPWPHEDDIE